MAVIMSLSHFRMLSSFTQNDVVPISFVSWELLLFLIPFQPAAIQAPAKMIPPAIANIEDGRGDGEAAAMWTEGRGGGR